MNRTDLLLKMLNTTFDKESWYVPFKPAIEGLTAEQARWRPVGEATKTIWENVNHLIYYKERLVANLEGREWTNNLDGDQTFYLTEQLNDDKEWIAVVELAEMVQRRLRQVLSKTTIEELQQNSLEEKLLQGSWPSHR
ncbi:DinB family protein [Psychrobacillus sp. FSL H8-0484]|uniref:DinB family protein n=1 Tax=Psychrobacillus sp. FSL H8-0484 TaxID=2921390 RepID=UPI0030FA56E2